MFDIFNTIFFSYFQREIVSSLIKDKEHAPPSVETNCLLVAFHMTRIS